MTFSQLPCEMPIDAPNRRGMRAFAAIPKTLAGMALILALAVPALAQDENVVQELQRLRRDLSDVQRFVFRGEQPARAPSASAPAPGDAEGAARLQRQVLEIRAQMRELTGHIERIQHDVRQIGGRLDKLVADEDIRLGALETGTPATPERPRMGSLQPPAPRRAPDGETTIISSGGVSTDQPAPGTGLSPRQKSLGTVSERDLAAVDRGRAVQPAEPSAAAPSAAAPVREPAKPAPPPQAAPVSGGVSASQMSVARPVSAGGLPEGTPRQQYDFAFGKLKQRNYDEAEVALRAFVDRHPDDALAGNAMYWMGETYYVRKQFPEAARIFLDAYQRFPKGNKAPDNLFKLAKSLVEIGETASACTTYAELMKTFPKANARIIASAASDMKRLACS